MTAMSKKTHTALNVALMVIGAAIVVLAVLVMEISVFPAITVTIAALLFSLGAVGIIRSLPRADRRVNRVLRSEIDHLVSLTRDLYRYRTRGDSAMIHETKASLRENLDRIIKAAALYRDEPEKAGSPAADE